MYTFKPNFAPTYQIPQGRERVFIFPEDSVRPTILTADHFYPFGCEKGLLSQEARNERVWANDILKVLVPGFSPEEACAGRTYQIPNDCPLTNQLGLKEIEEILTDWDTLDTGLKKLIKDGNEHHTGNLYGWRDITLDTKTGILCYPYRYIFGGNPLQIGWFNCEPVYM